MKNSRIHKSQWGCLRCRLWRQYGRRNHRSDIVFEIVRDEAVDDGALANTRVPQHHYSHSHCFLTLGNASCRNKLQYFPISSKRRNRWPREESRQQGTLSLSRVEIPTNRKRDADSRNHILMIQFDHHWATQREQVLCVGRFVQRHTTSKYARPCACIGHDRCGSTMMMHVPSLFKRIPARNILFSILARSQSRMCTSFPDLVQVKKALISVSDKTDLLVLAAALKEIGCEVWHSPLRPVTFH